MENDPLFGRDQICHERRNSDSEVDHIATLQFRQRAMGHLHARVVDLLVTRSHGCGCAQFVERRAGLDQVVDVATRRVDLIGIDLADGHDRFHLGDHEVGRGRHRLVEVLLGHPVDEIARGIGLPRADEGHIAPQPRHEDMSFAVDDLRLAFFADHRSR